MGIEEQLLREVRMQTAILRAAHRGALTDLATELHEDEASGAVMEALSESAEPLSARAISNVVAGTTKVSHRTVQARLAYLEELGVARRLGSGPSTRYELTGLIG